jgi:Domain of unknown function (DUF4091)
MRRTGFSSCPWLALLLAAAVCLAWPWNARAQPSGPARSVRLDVTRDTWVSEVGREANGNNGAAPRLKFKSIQEMTLLDADASPLRGRTIRSATLHLQKAGEERLWRVTISSVGAEWFEGTGSGYSVQPGGATFRHRRHPDLPWSIGGGDLCHVILGKGGTTWRMADASPPDRNGWQEVPVDPKVIAARVAGLSHGFLVFDDTGSEWTRQGESFIFRLFPNRFAYSRDQNRASAPYFEVELGPEDRRPPSAPIGLRVEPQTAGMPAGEALVSWVTPRDAGPGGTLGFFADLGGRALPRELIPMAREPGARVEMHLRDLGLPPGSAPMLSVRAVDAAGNIGPAASAAIRVSDRLPAALPGPATAASRSPSAAAKTLPRLGPIEVAVLDELDKVHPVTGELIPSQPDGYLAANHLWNADERRISLQASRNEFVSFQVLLRGDKLADRDPIIPELTFDAPAGRAPRVEFGRYQPVNSRNGPLPDPIVPMEFPGSSAIGARNRSLHAEIYVPHDLPAGDYRGTLTLSARGRAGQGALRLSVALRVWDFTLPDQLSFLPEMNAYGLPDNERDYYRLAHRHRTVLNRLPYNQNGRMADGCAPRWDGRRLALDWSDWDRRFGPLLDGSAFADLPRKGVPVDVFYLPLHENWPSPMEGNYNGNYWADRAFPESYRRAFVAASRGMAEHFRARGWTETLFQGFLNNKVDFKRRGWSRGSSPWLLDEPASFQDYWALHYFARAFHEGINQAAGSRAAPEQAASPASSSTWPRMVFRADISRPQWRRDSLDGLLDYHVVGGAVREYPRFVFDRKRASGEIVLEYGSTNPIEGSNIQPVGWCLDAWALGTDGIIPWQTIGNDDSWERADELSLFYPGRRRGQGAAGKPGPGVIPSIRLKAYRRGQQDVEYLTLWALLHKEPRWAVGRQVRAALNLAGTRHGTGLDVAEDAGRIDYARLRPQDLWALRVRLGEALSEAHPAPARKLVDFRTPRRDPEHLPPAEVSGGAEAGHRPR